jgi:hypothetical protein
MLESKINKSYLKISKTEDVKYSTKQETLSININDSIINNFKLIANSWNIYFLTIVETMNNAANNGDVSLI